MVGDIQCGVMKLVGISINYKHHAMNPESSSKNLRSAFNTWLQNTVPANQLLIDRHYKSKALVRVFDGLKNVVLRQRS
jgi:hypothetical protein